MADPPGSVADEVLTSSPTAGTEVVLGRRSRPTHESTDHSRNFPTSNGGTVDNGVPNQQSNNESNNNNNNDNTINNDNIISNNENDSRRDQNYADYLRTTTSLVEICEKFKADHDLKDKTREELMTIERPLWSTIRNWFYLHSSQTERLEAVRGWGESGQTVLHSLLRDFRTIPINILQLIIETDPSVLSQPDNFGFLPIHYAAAHLPPLEHLKLLLRHYPKGIIKTSLHKQTPLHFAVGASARENNYTMDELIQSIKLLLDEEGKAARKKDIRDHLPMMLACAAGAPIQVIKLLDEAYPGSIVKQDTTGRTPLHYVLANPTNKRSPEILRYILYHRIGVKSLAIANNYGDLPLDTFSQAASAVTKHKDRKVMRRFLIECLNVPKAPQADYFSTLRSLPNWLQATAFANPGVLLKNVLNENTSRPIPTMILCIDFYMLFTLIITFGFAAEETIACMYQGIEPSRSHSASLAFMFLSAFYFSFREVFQIYSMIKVGIFYRAWVKDLSNFIDVICIFLTYYWFSIMVMDCNKFGQDQKDTYRSGMALTSGLYWLNFLLYLRAASVDVAVFVGGVIHVLQSLATFLISLLIVLVAFAQMFYNLSQGSNRCLCNDPNLENLNEFVQNRCNIDNVVDETSASQNFCSTYQESLLTVYYMMIGQAETDDVTFSVVSTVLFCIFMFLAVILLTNILIAIVTESYVFVKDNNSSEVFWSNRFAFLVEVDPINRLFTEQIRKIKNRNNTNDDENSKGASRSSSPSNNSSGGGGGDSDSDNNSDDDEGDDSEEEVSFCSEIDRLNYNSDDVGYDNCLLPSEKWKEELWDNLSFVYESEPWADLKSWEYLCPGIILYLMTIVYTLLMAIWVCLGIVSAGLLWPCQVRKYLLEQRIGGNNLVGMINDDNNNNNDGGALLFDTNTSKSSRSLGRQPSSSLFFVAPNNNNYNNSRANINNNAFNNSSQINDLMELKKNMNEIQNEVISSKVEFSSEMSELKTMLLRLERSMAASVPR